VLVNVIRAIEQHVEWIGDMLDHLRDRGVCRVETTRDAQTEWSDQVAELAQHTVHKYADSWYLGSNVSGKRRQFLPFLGGLSRYRQRCDEVASTGYPGFVFDGEAAS
jgi:cyclohexanone monooxygenase